MNAALQENIDDVLERVVGNGERVVLHENGKEVAVIVPIADLAIIEEIEDLLDNDEADRALADMDNTGGRPVPIEVIKKKLGLA